MSSATAVDGASSQLNSHILVPLPPPLPPIVSSSSSCCSSSSSLHPVAQCLKRVFLGEHVCHKPAEQHGCQARCASCRYYCTQRCDHGGLHTTRHGNQAEKIFIAT